jgi:hypothetical protein
MFRYSAPRLTVPAVSAPSNFAVLSWMFARLDRVIAGNGSLGLWKFAGEALGWRLLAWLDLACLYALI